MINGFEEITKEVRKKEQEWVDYIIGQLKFRSKKFAIKNRELIEYGQMKGLAKISEVRVRKIIHLIRINGAVERLIATSRGYYVAKSKEEFETYIESLHQRENSISDIRKQLEWQLEQME